MTAFKQILVPIDFSAHSKATLDVAIDIAKAFDGEIQLLHCYHVPSSGIAPYGVVVPQEYSNDLHDAAKAQLEKVRAEVEAAGIRTGAFLSPDSPSQEISRAAEKIAADLIVMGTRGLSGVKHAMLGSVAERTVRSAPCPVLTVKGTD